MSASALTPRLRRRTLVIGAVALLVATAFSLAAGPSGVSLDGLCGDGESTALDLRLPRVLLSLAVGAALACCGAALQALLRNPLAEPYIIGVSGGAAVGGALVMAVGVGGFLSLVSVGAMAGALVASAALGWFVARERRGTHATLLAGVVFNAFAAAIITLLKTVLPATRTQALLFWLVGSLDYVELPLALGVAGAVLVAVAVLISRAGELELLALGEDEALRLGVDARRARIFTWLAASALVGVVVPVTGLIGFVGLVVPHALRIVVSPDQRLLLPASALFGAASLALFDGFSRLSFVAFDTELPVGALTALVGAPIFAVVLARHITRRPT